MSDSDIDCFSMLLEQIIKQNKAILEHVSICEKSLCGLMIQHTLFVHGGNEDVRGVSNAEMEKTIVVAKRS